MEILACKDEFDWVEAVNAWLSRQIEHHKVRRVFVPAGETPRPLYKSWEANHPKFLKNLCLVQLDEILSGEGRGSFQKFFEDTLPSFSEQIEFIKEAEGGADLAILGLGPNGHVAFHEPGLPRSFFSGCLRLNNDTAQRLKISPDSQVVSYGVDAFLRTKAIGLIARGEAKKKILEQILQPDSNAPAAWLKSHPELIIITDFAI